MEYVCAGECTYLSLRALLLATLSRGRGTPYAEPGWMPPRYRFRAAFPDGFDDTETGQEGSAKAWLVLVSPQRDISMSPAQHSCRYPLDLTWSWGISLVSPHPIFCTYLFFGYQINRTGPILSPSEERDLTWWGRLGI
ncbi:hypothetical protein VTJ04DRAFT_7058 [Mycothermus thermophilus]|uniref:uncharacterized protein n=1 Tax=Humicola insolens TaxID=85995 RepID=UPI003744A9CA